MYQINILYTLNLYNVVCQILYQFFLKNPVIKWEKKLELSHLKCTSRVQIQLQRGHRFSEALYPKSRTPDLEKQLCKLQST